MSDTADYRDTVFLPQTPFPMKAGLPQKEPGILAKWEADGLYRRVREARAGAPKFILHDGPPYANGDMHIGHALNHVLKDAVCRTQNLIGRDAPYVPGWDCHGLPIEWKVEEQYRKAKRSKNEVDPREFRAECRAYAAHWVGVQREQLKRLGVLGDWDNPYLTMDPEAEATIVAELLRFAEAGNLYRGSKPVMWSPVEETALAEAEVEYEDITSTQIDVAFEIIESPISELVGAHAVIWTTTPWTVPVNQAIAYGPEVDYTLYDVGIAVSVRAGLDVFAHPAVQHWQMKQVVIAGNAAQRSEFEERFRNSYSGEVSCTLVERKRFKGSDLAGTLVRHPMHALGGFYAAPRPLLPGDFVTTDAGTGLVHMAPDHGEDDFALCAAHGIGPAFAVMDDGRYRDDWPWLGGSDERRRSVINPGFNAPDGPICSDLRAAGALLAASADYRHSYPHSWRSKAKVIFRATPQWFVPMDRDLGTGATLRQTALAEIERVRFVPEKGRNRIGSMVAGRPDWVLSRQRAWGVPITLFLDRRTGEYLRDPAVNARIVAAVRAGGVDAWDEARKSEFLGHGYDPQAFEMVTDILDVWFDSGSTHAFVLESGRWPDLRWPADLYLEGSDQHRGWFQSSLLESCATRGRAPYDAVLTHGFTMAADGRKMSKSLGNTVDPLKVMETYGADIIRLWALSVDFTEDHRIGDEILKGVADQYRKLRNTFRYLLGALDGFTEAERLPHEEMPELERYILGRLAQVDGTLRAAIDAFDFNTYTRTLIEFCNEDLSAFYFDIRKDRLYCDAPGDPHRRACRTVFDILFHALVRYAAPVLVFTAEEVWATRFPQGGSVHLLTLAPVPPEWRDEALAARYADLRAVRGQVLEAIEPLRRDKTVRSGLEAAVTVPAGAVPAGVDDAGLAELFITASVTRGDGEGVRVTPTTDAKCGRCWRHLPEVAEEGALCARCDAVLADGALACAS